MQNHENKTTPPNDYNTLNAHPRDNMLRFVAEDHTYHYGSQQLMPVTSVIESCFEQFDADYWAPRTAQKLGISEVEVRAMWERKGAEARNLGTLMHEKIERHYMGYTNESDETYRLFEMFSQCYVLQPFRTEWSIFDEELGVAGTIDFIEKRDDVFTIFDWKRSDKLMSCGRPVVTNRYGKCAKRPLHHLPDTTYWHYALQVSIYRLMLARKYGINVSRCFLAVFHPNNPTYHVLEMPYLENELRRLFRIK